MKYLLIVTFLLASTSSAKAGFLSPLFNASPEIESTRPIDYSRGKPASTPREAEKMMANNNKPTDEHKSFFSNLLEKAKSAVNAITNYVRTNNENIVESEPQEQKQVVAHKKITEAEVQSEDIQSKPGYKPMPIPSTSGLPVTTKVGEVILPHFNFTKKTHPLEKMPQWNLKGIGQKKLMAFTEKALHMPLPIDRPSVINRGRATAEKYKEALTVSPYQQIRSLLSIEVVKTAQAPTAPQPLVFEFFSKRMDALFYALDQEYKLSFAFLWDLSKISDSKYRDALFAGIIAKRAGWEHASSIAYQHAIKNGIELDPKYFSLLWKELGSLSKDEFIDQNLKLLQQKTWRNIAIDTKNDHGFFVLTNHEKNIADIAKKITPGSYYDHKLKLAANMENLDKAESVAVLEAIGTSPYIDLSNEANLDLGRYYSQKGDFAKALAHYENVEKNRGLKLELLQELAYTELKLGDYQASLGKALGVGSPFFKYAFAPDIYFLEAASRNALCDFGGANFSMEKFSAIYTSEKSGLEENLSAKQNDPHYLYKATAASFSKKNPRRFERYALHLPGMQAVQYQIVSWGKEFDALTKPSHYEYAPKEPANWNIIIAELKSEVDFENNKYLDSIEKILLTEERYLLDRLEKLFTQSELMKLDVATRASAEYNRQNAMNYPVVEQKEYKVPGGKILWPFENEIWEDELADLRSRNPSKCMSKVAKSQ